MGEELSDRNMPGFCRNIALGRDFLNATVISKHISSNARTMGFKHQKFVHVAKSESRTEETGPPTNDPVYSIELLFALASDRSGVQRTLPTEDQFLRNNCKAEIGCTKHPEICLRGLAQYSIKAHHQQVEIPCLRVASSGRSMPTNENYGRLLRGSSATRLQPLVICPSLSCKNVGRAPTGCGLPAT